VDKPLLYVLGNCLVYQKWSEMKNSKVVNN
jgi:hypothetical protein